jgi:hypothetical protein
MYQIFALAANFTDLYDIHKKQKFEEKKGHKGNFPICPYPKDAPWVNNIMFSL